MRIFKIDPGDVILLIISAIVALACNVVAFGQPPAVPQAPPIVPEQAPKIKQEFPRYTQKLLDTTKGPIIVFVGVTARKIDGAIVCQEGELDRDGSTKIVTRAIMVTVDRKTSQWYVAESTDAQLRTVLGVRTSVPFVGQESEPIRSSREAVLPQVADGDDQGGPWPASLPRPDGLERYTPTRHTQESYDRNITGRAFIAWIDRSALETKWRVPGGLAGVHGWRSTLYRGVANKARYWRGDENPGELYSVQAHQRAYDDGAVFADVLTNDSGRVFEVRFAEKVNGRWDRFIAFKDSAERPVGYVPPSSGQCVACHVAAGSGGYASARVPGGDTVISEAFAEMGR